MDIDMIHKDTHKIRVDDRPLKSMSKRMMTIYDACLQEVRFSHMEAIERMIFYILKPKKP